MGNLKKGGKEGGGREVLSDVERERKVWMEGICDRVLISTH